jgi:hypothetical protein
VSLTQCHLAVAAPLVVVVVLWGWGAFQALWNQSEEFFMGLFPRLKLAFQTLCNQSKNSVEGESEGKSDETNVVRWNKV